MATHYFAGKPQSPAKGDLSAKSKQPIHISQTEFQIIKMLGILHSTNKLLHAF